MIALRSATELIYSASGDPALANPEEMPALRGRR
jgi:hypothetical protein